MATTKVVLRKKRNKDGTYPLALRITKNRKSSFIHLGYHLNENDWDATAQRVRKSHPNSTRLNNFILKKTSQASDTSLEVETNKPEASPRLIKQKIKPTSGTMFFAQADLYLERLKAAGNYNRYIPDQSRIKQFKAFLNGGDISFPEITTGLLERFKSHLKSRPKIRPDKDKNKKGLSERSIMNNLIVIRDVFSQAIKEGVTEAKYYPFGKEKVSIKLPESTKIGIGEKDVESLELVKLDKEPHNRARNLWLVSYYFAGMRISDVLRLRWSDFHDLRLHYTMGKNSKPGSLKAPEKALNILAQYEDLRAKADDLIFPDLRVLPDLSDEFEVKRKIANAVNRYDKILRLEVAPKAKIYAKLTMHISRHTFATRAGDKIPIQMLQKLYRHSDIKTTIGYQANFIHKDADDALDAVLGS